MEKINTKLELKKTLLKEKTLRINELKESLKYSLKNNNNNNLV